MMMMNACGIACPFHETAVLRMHCDQKIYVTSSFER
jgi:hypothetical protein